MPIDPCTAPDTCPRCGRRFACGVAGAAPCACTGVTLDAATLAALQARYRGCLCLDCLRECAAETPGQPAVAGQLDGVP